jgi:hypothetical protein
MSLRSRVQHHAQELVIAFVQRDSALAMKESDEITR